MMNNIRIRGRLEDGKKSGLILNVSMSIPVITTLVDLLCSFSFPNKSLVKFSTSSGNLIITVFRGRCETLVRDYLLCHYKVWLNGHFSASSLIIIISKLQREKEELSKSKLRKLERSGNKASAITHRLCEIWELWFLIFMTKILEGNKNGTKWIIQLMWKPRLEKKREREREINNSLNLPFINSSPKL